MGEVIQFPGSFQGDKTQDSSGSTLSPEALAAIEVAQRAVKDSARETTVETGTLKFGPGLIRQEDELDRWTAERLGEENNGGPNLTVV